MSAEDSRVRSAHAELDGQTRGMDEPFVNALGDIMYPGDPHAKPANVYNCRCTLGTEIVGFRNSFTEGLSFVENNGIMISGAKITNQYSKNAIAHAKKFYEEIRHRTTDVKKIAFNIGESEENIQKIKNYLFLDKSLYDESTQSYRRFDPNVAIAQTWQRLADGKNILPHDKTLILHELYEMQIKKDNPRISHDQAHIIATQKYNYGKESDEYYDSLEKHNQNDGND